MPVPEASKHSRISQSHSIITTKPIHVCMCVYVCADVHVCVWDLEEWERKNKRTKERVMLEHFGH